jgi:FAD/FMN-containing dehydrogenase
VVLPADETYAEARALANLEFSVTRPQAIVHCRSAEDVAEAIRFAQAFGLSAVPRSGGHSFAGFSTSTGLVIDVSWMNAVTVGDGLVRSEAGTQIVDLYDHTLPRGLAVPTGWCPTVGIAGLALGGGLGLEGRRYGLTVDHMVYAEVVLADGRIVRCDEQHDPELFWALRGGGGGNFGIVTELGFRPVEVDAMTNYALSWDWPDAVAVLDGWQQWAVSTPDGMTPVLTVELEDAAPGAQPRLTVHGAWLERPADLKPLLERLVKLVGRDPASSSQETVPYADGIKHWFGCDGMTTAECHTVGHNPEAKLPRVAFARARGNFCTASVPTEGVAALLTAFDAQRRAGQMRNLDFLTLGGAINRVPADATAFVHRNSRYYLGFAVGMMEEVPEVEQQAATDWVDHCWAELQNWSAPYTYQNFVDPQLTDWRERYYGANYDRLARVRAVYDPHRFFRFPQAIS